MPCLSGDEPLWTKLDAHIIHHAKKNFSVVIIYSLFVCFSYCGLPLPQNWSLKVLCLALSHEAQSSCPPNMFCGPVSKQKFFSCPKSTWSNLYSDGLFYTIWPQQVGLMMVQVKVTSGSRYTMHLLIVEFIKALYYIDTAFFKWYMRYAIFCSIVFLIITI